MGAAACFAAGSEIWLPNRESGLFRWYIGSVATVAAGKVTSWTDVSSSGVNMAPQVANPSYNLNPLNNWPTVHWASADAGYATIAGFGALTAGHGFVVFRNSLNPPLGTQGIVWDCGSSGLQPGIPFSDGNIYDDFGSTVRKACGAAIVPMNVYTIYEVETAAGSWTNRINGAQQFTTAVNTVGFNATFFVAGGGAQRLDGDVAEMILYNKVLAATPALNVRRYLGAKYGITVP